MKKVILAFDGDNYSQGAFEFARQMNEIEPLLLTGIFLPFTEYANLSTLVSQTGLVYTVAQGSGKDIIDRNILKFEEACRKNNIQYRIHKDADDFALAELKTETWFADLLITGSESFYQDAESKTINAFLREILHSAGCLVAVVPEKFEFPQNNILAYDGTESSVYAIKQFAYTFPFLTKNKTYLVYSKSDLEDTLNTLPEQANIEELVARHFTDLTVTKLNFNPKESFDTWINFKKGVILVSGAFGRSLFSRIIKKSFATNIISVHKFPVFIAHR
jgi:hypothetical protein